MSNDIISIPAPDLTSSDKPLDIYIAKKEQRIVAVAYQIIAPDGYAGPIALMLGINIKGEILGVRIISHKETPGLGDKIEEKKDDWILSFDGLSSGNTKRDDWAVKKDGGRFDQFSGATITPRSVVKAIQRGLDFFDLHKTEILDKYTSSQVSTS